MSDQYPRATPDDRIFDDAILPHNASNQAERQQVFNEAVNLGWAGEDIGKVERFEPAGARYYLAMWRYRPGNE